MWPSGPEKMMIFASFRLVRSNLSLELSVPAQEFWIVIVTALPDVLARLVKETYQHGT